MTEMIPTMINEQWEILLPEHRAARPEWPHWERPRMESIHNALPALAGDRRPTIWDIGAEEGDMAGLFSMWGYDVICAEPNPRVWPNLKAIWEANELNPMTAKFIGFIGDTDRPALDQLAGTGWWFNPNQWPPAAHGPVIGDHGFCNLWERPDIPAIKLDTAVENYGLACDAITMDVEGAEMRVLDGARNVIQHVRPWVWVSLHADWILEPYGDKPTDVLAFFDEYGYTATLVDDASHEAHWLFTP